MTLELPPIRHCPRCGAPVAVRSMEGRDRPVCGTCGHIVYINPIPAATLALVEGGDVLLTLRDVDPHRGEWCLPGGFLEWGESPEAGARRELAEETGIRAGALELVGVYDSISTITTHVLLVGYRVLDWDGDPVAGDDAAAVKWFPLEAVPPLAFEAHTRLLSDVRDRLRR